MPRFILSSGFGLGDALDLHDITNFFVEEKTYVVGQIAKDGSRPINLTLFIQGASTDQLANNQAQLSYKLEEAKVADSPNGFGQPVMLWVKLGDAQEFTYWTVKSGTVNYEDVAAASEKQIRAKVVLTCYEDAIAEQVLLNPSPAVGSNQPIFVPRVKGDCSALLNLIVKQTGGPPINHLLVARHGHRNMQFGDFKGYYNCPGTVALTQNWQTISHFSSNQGKFDSSLFDVVAQLIDSSKTMPAISDLDGTLEPSGGLLGGFYDYEISTIDGFGEESAPSDSFFIEVPTGSNLIQDPLPDPKSLKWAGPEFLGGTCLNPGRYSVDGPGLCVATSQGLQVQVQSDGWILSDIITNPLLIPNVPDGNVGATNKIPPKPGEIGYATTYLAQAFATPVTGQEVYQYDLTLNSLTQGSLLSPIFFPQMAPFGLMRSPFGWAFYSSSASSSFDTETLIGDWKSGKLEYVVLPGFTDASFVGHTNTITISADWRNGPLVGTLAINHISVATLDSGKNGAPANDVSLGITVSNEVPEFVYSRVINPDKATWSYTKVQVTNTSDSTSNSTSTSTSLSSSESSSDSKSTSDSKSHSTSDSDSASLSDSHSTSSSISNSSDGSTSDNGSENGSHSTSTSQDDLGGTSTSDGAGLGSGTSSSTSNSLSNSNSVSQSDSGSDSSSSSSSTSDSVSDSNSLSHSDSISSSSSNSSSNSTSTSHSETTVDNISYDIPVTSYTRLVTHVGQVTTKSVSKSKSTSTSLSSSFSLSDSTSISTSLSTSDSNSSSRSESSSSSNSTSDSDSKSASSSTSNSLSDSSGDNDSTSGDGIGTSNTHDHNTSSSGSTSNNNSNSESTSSSPSKSSSSSDSHSSSISHSLSNSDSSSLSHSASTSSSTSNSDSDSDSTSLSVQDVYLIQPLIETILPAAGFSVASANAFFLNVQLCDGPIGLGQSVLLNWTPLNQGGTQRVYRIQNTGSGSPSNNWEFKNLGGSDSSFLDSNQSGWTAGNPPSLFSGPQSAFFRLAYSANPSDPLRFTEGVQAVLSNGKPEFLNLTSLNLPPNARPEPENANPGPFYVELQAMTDATTIKQNPSASILGVYLLPTTEPQFNADFHGDTNTQNLIWNLDKRRDRRGSGRTFQLDGTTLVSNLDISGDLDLVPGSDYLIILASGKDGVADPAIQFTAQIIYTPRTKFSYGY